MRYLVAADTGGTFTDIVVFGQRTKATQFGKTFTNYRDLVAGVLDGLSDTDGHLDEAAVFKHGTTHVINAFVQRKGARTALVTTEGFRDLLEIGRGNRASPFNLAYRRFAPLVPRELRFEVTERTLADGTAVQARDPIALRDIAARLRAEKIEAVAVSFLNAYRNPANETLAKRILAEELPGTFVTTGAELSREWSEYERTSTAAANAYVGSRVSEYMGLFDRQFRAQSFPGAFYMMGSNGGLMSADQTLAQSRRVWAVSLITLGSPIGNSLAVICGGLLLSADGYLGIAGWRWIFLVTGTVSAAFGIVTFLFLPNEPVDASFLSPGKRARLIEMIRAETGPSRHEAGNFWRTVLNLDVAAYSLLFAAILTSSFGVVYWLPTVVRSLGASSAQNGLINEMPWGLSALMLILVPPFRRNERRVFWAMVVASAVALVCFGCSTILINNWQRFITMMIAMPCMSLLLPSFWWLPSRAFAGERSARAFAAITTIGMMGGFFAQSLMPLAAQLTGKPIGAMLVPAACNALVLLVLICFQWRGV